MPGRHQLLEQEQQRQRLPRLHHGRAWAAWTYKKPMLVVANCGTDEVLPISERVRSKYQQGRIVRFAYDVEEPGAHGARVVQEVSTTWLLDQTPLHVPGNQAGH